jgi:integrase
MPNHIYLIAVPETKDGLNLAIGEAHRRYTRQINFREGWRGHLWQGRFSSFIMDERYLLACAKYIELNPVRAGLVKSPEKWRWSTAAPHITGKDDLLVKTKPLCNLINKNWKDFLAFDVEKAEIELFRKHERTGRPLGEDLFIGKIEIFLNLLTSTEIEKIIGKTCKIRYRVFLLTIYSMGLRLEEALSIQVCDIDAGMNKTFIFVGAKGIKIAWCRCRV